MRTDDLIAALVADRTASTRSVARKLALALAVGGVLSLALFMAMFGVRGDLVASLATWRFDFKIGWVLLALVLAFGLCRGLSGPVAPLRPGRQLLPLVGLMAAAVAAELVLLPPSAWRANLAGGNWLGCLISIVVLSVAPLVAALVALRNAAPASPALAGAAAGLLAAAAASAVYLLHCFDDSPLFVATWYTLAALLVTAVGALAGHRLLRW
jgi:hypothetical protein